MKISSKGRYALLLLLDLAEHYKSDAVTLKEVAERKNISKKYLEQVIPIVSKAGILKTSRGAQGGYKLNEAPSSISAYKILSLTESQLNEEREEDGEYALNTLSKGMDKALREYLESVSLEELLLLQKNVESDSYMI